MITPLPPQIKVRENPKQTLAALRKFGDQARAEVAKSNDWLKTKKLQQNAIKAAIQKQTKALIVGNKGQEDAIDIDRAKLAMIEKDLAATQAYIAKAKATGGYC